MNIKSIKIILKNCVPSSIYLRYRYKKVMHKKLHLKNPQTLNEKLQWLKLNDRNPLYSTMVDKYEAKGYLEKLIGKEYIIPTLGIYDKFEEIDFDKLPNEFVIKCTHDSGGVVICKDKKNFDIKTAKEKIIKSLNTNFYYDSREWPYKNVQPRIIAEKYMGDNLNDYKFFCFNGVVKFFKVDFDRFIKHGANYYDVNGNLLFFGEQICPPNFDKKIKMPDNLNKMISLASKIAKDIPFVRVDFYNIDGKIYFGEITFFPASGFGKFVPDEWDYKLGDMLDISMVKKNAK